MNSDINDLIDRFALVMPTGRVAENVEKLQAFCEVRVIDEIRDGETCVHVKLTGYQSEAEWDALVDQLDELCDEWHFE